VVVALCSSAGGAVLDDVGGVLARVKSEMHECIYCRGIK
jgi:hypothetical protein